MCNGICLVFFLAAGVAADTPKEDARAIIEKAVKAQGGLELLGKQGASTGKLKGGYVGDNLDFTGEFHSQGAGKLRLSLQLKEQGNRLLVLNGKKGWLVFDGITQELEEETLGRLHKANYVDRVSGLTTLLKDKGYTLTLQGEIKIEDKPAATVKVTAEGQPDVHLYFDKDSGFLVKAAHRGPETGRNREVLHETYFRDYQLVGTSARDQKTLKDAKRDLSGPGLVKALRENIPDAKTREQIQTLIQQLGDESFAIRQKASVGLTKHGLRAAALLRPARRTAELEVARRVDKCLERLAPEIALAAATVRMVAIRQPAGGTEALLAFFLYAPDENVAREIQDAIFAIAQNGKKPDPALVKALTDPEVRLRQIAAAALGKDGGEYLKRPGRRLIVEGLRLPRVTVLYVEGQKRMELETREQEFFNRLDDALFARPEIGPVR